MQQFINHLISVYLEFERWFEKNFGWFFTNGAKNEVPADSKN